MVSFASVLATLVIAPIAALSAKPASSLDGNPFFYNPRMTGAVDKGAVKAKPGEGITYSVVQTDKDRVNLSGSDVDTTADINGKFVSMARFIWTRSGPDKDGKTEYTFTGITPMEVGVYVDEIRLFNARFPFDQYCDPDVYLAKVVNVAAGGSDGKGMRFAQTTTVNPFTSRPGAWSLQTPLRLGETLRKNLKAEFMNLEIKALKAGDRVSMLITDVSNQLRGKLDVYVQAQIKRVAPLVATYGGIDIGRLSEFKVIVLPKPSTDIAIQGYLKDGRRVTF